MKYYIILIIAFSIYIPKINAMDLIKQPFNEDTLTLKGKIKKADMESQKGTKLKDVQDYYFLNNGKSYFIKTASGIYSKQDLDKLGKKEITIKAIIKNGPMDIDSDDPAYAATRIGEYIIIIEILKR